jgi:hypothetical protein
MHSHKLFLVQHTTWETTNALDPKIAEHRGRIVKTTGDGIPVEFASVADAVRCANAIQRGMGKRNVDVPYDKRIEFRIDINVGNNRGKARHFSYGPDGDLPSRPLSGRHLEASGHCASRAQQARFMSMRPNARWPAIARADRRSAAAGPSRLGRRRKYNSPAASR